MTYNYRKDAHLALVTGDDAGAGSGLTAWRNADAEFIAGELIPSDILLGWKNKPPAYVTRKIGAMGTTQAPHRFSDRRSQGKWESTHAYQTIQFLFWLMQTAGTPTNEGTPAGYNTTTLTIGASNIPLWYGMHFEREGITSNELRYALMGLLTSDLEISCGESKDAFNAVQKVTIPYSFLKTGVTELAPQTLRPYNSIGSIWKNWNHLITGDGAGKDVQGLTYNANPLEVDVTHVTLRFHRDVYFSNFDTNGYPTMAIYNGGWSYKFILDIKPIGDLFYTVNRAKKESYAGDLDYIFDFVADATNDKHTHTFDKMYMVPVDEENDWDKNIEGYKVTFEPLDTTSSYQCVGIGNLDNTHFENP